MCITILYMAKAQPTTSPMQLVENARANLGHMLEKHEIMQGIEFTEMELLRVDTHLRQHMGNPADVREAYHKLLRVADKNNEKPFVIPKEKVELDLNDPNYNPHACGVNGFGS